MATNGGLRFCALTSVDALFVLMWGIMDFNIYDLWDYKLSDLREIGSNLGVKAPTMLKKEDLIGAIINVANHVVSPQFTNRGRPRLEKPKSESVKKVIEDILNGDESPKTETVIKIDFAGKELDIIKEIYDLFDDVKKRLIDILTKTR